MQKILVILFSIAFLTSQAFSNPLGLSSFAVPLNHQKSVSLTNFSPEQINFAWGSLTPIYSVLSDESLQDAKTNLVLATANEAAAITMAIASAASAAASTKTGGFNASLMVEGEVNEQSHKEKSETNKASSLVATNGNINLTASENITQVGSHVISQEGDITYDAGKDITIKASKDVTRTQDKNESYNASVTIGTGGMSGSIGFEQGGSKSTEVNYNNSTAQADKGKVTLKSGNDATLSGANVYAENGTLTYNVAKDLTIQASKDTHSAENKSEHISGGVSVGNNAVQVREVLAVRHILRRICNIYSSPVSGTSLVSRKATVGGVTTDLGLPINIIPA